MSEEKIYQPRWDKHKERQAHHHHHHHSYSSDSGHRTNTWGGWLKLRDRQAYYGLMLIVIAIIGFATYKLVMMFVDELRQMPMDDPTAERPVDELRVRKVEEQDALMFGDSLAKAENLDSIQRKVQIDTRPVYRPPRKENEWYITQREWKAIWKNYQIWRWEKRRDKEEQKREQEERKRNKE